MRRIHISFLQMIRQLKNDSLLMIILFVPFFTGGLLRFGLPLAEAQLTAYFSIPAIFAPYYHPADVFFSLLTPTILNFVAALIILEEADDRIISYLVVTPLGKKGYLMSRLGIVTLLTIPLNLFVTRLFQLSDFKLSFVIVLCFFGAMHGLVVSLMIVALSSNKVEGMAVGKLTSVLTIGLVVPYFLTGWLPYLFAGLPSFWIAKFMLTNRFLFLAIAFAIDLLFIRLFIRRFATKIR